MARFTSLVAALAVSALSFSASAQERTVIKVIEPVPTTSSDLVHIQFSKPANISTDDYARMLEEEARRIRAYQASRTGTAAPVMTYNARTQTQQPSYTQPAPQTQTYDSLQPGQTVLYESPVAAAPNTTLLQTQQTSTQSTYMSPSITHTVATGETLYGISKRYGVPLRSLINTNRLRTSIIHAGQQLSIPSVEKVIGQQTPTPQAQNIIQQTPAPQPSNNVIRTSQVSSPNVIYAVLPNETLHTISTYACVDIVELAQANNITSANSLQPGQRLVIPAGHCLR